MADIYDGAFHTILNDCSRLIIPVINEIFNENYIGDEKIEFHQEEHFIDQLNAPDVKRITDSNFTINGIDESKNYHKEVCRFAAAVGAILRAD